MILESERFNRNIVECKASSRIIETAFSSGFNRNIVECKGVSTAADGAPAIDLIETSWNVKSLIITRPDARSTMI